MAYWSIVILTVDIDGYYNIHHRTYLWFTGLPLYLHLTKMVTITYIIVLIYGYWFTLILKVDSDGYYNIHHITYLWYTGLP